MKKKPSIFKRIFSRTEVKPKLTTAINLTNLDGTIVNGITSSGNYDVGINISGVRNSIVSNVIHHSISPEKELFSLIDKLSEQGGENNDIIVALLKKCHNSSNVTQKKSSYIELLEFIQLHQSVLPPLAAGAGKVLGAFLSSLGIYTS